MKLLRLMILVLLSGNMYGQNVLSTNPSLRPGKIALNEETKEGTIEFVYVEGQKDHSLREYNASSLTISLLNFYPKEGIKSVGGTLGAAYSWQYDPTINTFFGTQIADIRANVEGTITVAVLSPNPAFCSQGKTHGYSINIQPSPEFVEGNSTTDDHASAFGCVQQNIQGEATLTVTPNPTSDFISVGLNKSVAKAKIAIYNVGGALVKSVSNEYKLGQKIDITNLADGLYTVQLTADDVVYNQKLIVFKR